VRFNEKRIDVEILKVSQRRIETLNMSNLESTRPFAWASRIISSLSTKVSMKVFTQSKLPPAGDGGFGNVEMRMRRYYNRNRLAIIQQFFPGMDKPDPRIIFQYRPPVRD
jgi:hypothetical protein